MNDDTDRIDGLERLARARAPDRDLWPGVAARLAPRRRSRDGLVQLALAASVVAGLAAVFTLSLQRPSAPPATSVASAADRMLTHDSRAIVEANVTLVEHAERQLRQALAETPDSHSLREMLARAENRQRALRALL